MREICCVHLSSCAWIASFLSHLFLWSKLNCNRGKRHQLCGGPCGEVLFPVDLRREAHSVRGTVWERERVEIDPAFVASSTGLGSLEPNLSKTNHRVHLLWSSLDLFALFPLSKVSLLILIWVCSQTSSASFEQPVARETIFHLGFNSNANPGLSVCLSL